MIKIHGKYSRIVWMFIIILILLISNLILSILVYQTNEDNKRKSSRLFAYLNAPQYYGSFSSKEEKEDTKIRVRTKVEYASQNNNEPNVIYLSKKRMIPYKDLQTTTYEILEFLPHIRPDKNFISLVVETLITETHGGLNYRTKNLGGLGIAQVNYKTAQYLMDILKKDNDKEVFPAIKSLYNKSMTLEENLIHNLSFSVAICATYYWKRIGNNIYNGTSTIEQRAVIWKEVYNTHLGAGTVEAYLSRVKSYPKNR